jgi:hypothetical protein
MFGHNSGTPGVISTKLGTYIAIWLCSEERKKQDGRILEEEIARYIIFVANEY